MPERASASTAQEPTRSFTTAGDYEVRLRVTVGGVSTIAALVVHVHATNDDPSAWFSYQTGDQNSYCGYYGYCSLRVLEDHAVTQWIHVHSQDLAHRHAIRYP